MTPDATRDVRLPGPVDVDQTLVRHAIFWTGPSFRRDGGGVQRAVHTDAGPSSVHYTPLAEGLVRVDAWGPGAEELVDTAPRILGADDDPEAFAPTDEPLRTLARRFPGLRFGASGRVWDALVPAILGQLVTGKGAARSFREVIRAYGEPAPGPAGLVCVPTPERMATLAPFHLVPCGIEAKRARTLLSSAHHHKKLRRVEAMAADEAMAFLQKLPGIGPWTAALVVASSHGDPDAVPVGDYNLPNLVGWHLAGKHRSDDAEMLALLEPYRPHRGRAVRLLKLSGEGPPRRGPRSDVRDIR